MDLILNKFKFNKKQFNKITIYYLLNTEFEDRIDRIESFNIINKYKEIDIELLYSFLEEQKLLKEISFSPFGTDSFCFLHFIEHFDCDNYIIKNLHKFRRHITEKFYYNNYIEYYHKTISVQKIKNF